MSAGHGFRRRRRHRAGDSDDDFTTTAENYGSTGRVHDCGTYAFNRGSTGEHNCGADVRERCSGGHDKHDNHKHFSAHNHDQRSPSNHKEHHCDLYDCAADRHQHHYDDHDNDDCAADHHQHHHDNLDDDHHGAA